MLEVLISSMILALIVMGSLTMLSDMHQTQRDVTERTAALYKLSSVMEIHRHSPHLVDVYTPVLFSPIASVAEFGLVDTTVTELTDRQRFEASIEWLNQYDGAAQSFGLAQSHIGGPRHLCISSDCPKLEGTPVEPVRHEAVKPPVDYESIFLDEDLEALENPDEYTTCTNGDNGFGNGDAPAPGDSGPNNNAANAGNPDREDCDKHTWKFPT